ncbi:hypothetical protein NBRC116586_12960 [Pseudooceanicola nitratireducens]
MSQFSVSGDLPFISFWASSAQASFFDAMVKILLLAGGAVAGGPARRSGNFSSGWDRKWKGIGTNPDAMDDGAAFRPYIGRYGGLAIDA